MAVKIVRPELARDAGFRTLIWGKIDRQIMTDAAFLPEAYASALLYRNPDLTNVYVDPR